MDKIRVNFNKEVKMNLACANDDLLRPVMSQIYFKDGFAYATDGIILVKNKIDECSTIDPEQIKLLENKYLHKDHYRDILKYDIIQISEEGIEAHKTNGGEKAFFYFSNADYKYPSAENLLQSILNKQNAELSDVGLNLKSVDRLRKSLFDSDRCRFRFKGDKTNLHVILESYETNISIGLIMPINI